MEEREIDLIEVIKDIFKNWKRLLLISIIFGLLIGIVFGLKESKDTLVTGKLLVLQNNESPHNYIDSNSTYEVYNYSLIETKNESESYSIDEKEKLSINDIISIINSDKLLDKVYDDCDYLNELDIVKEKIDYSNIFDISKDTNSNLIIIGCKINDLELAKRSIISLVDNFKSYANEIIDVKTIELISGPFIEEEHKLLSGLIKYGAIGFVVGAMVYCGYVLVKHMLDNKIRSESEIKMILDSHIISYCENNKEINNNEIVDLITNKKLKTTNFISINKNIITESIINEVVASLEKINKKVLLMDEVKNSTKSSKNDYLLINSKCCKESHDYINNAKLANASIVFVKKELDKFEDLEKLRDEIKLYDLNITAIVFIK